MSHLSFSMRLAELAALIGAELDGASDPNYLVTGVASLHDASRTEVSYLARRDMLEAAARTNAGAVITTPELASSLPPHVQRLYSPKPEEAFVTLLEHLLAQARPVGGSIHPTAVIASTASIAPTARIAAYAVIGEHCTIGDGVEIGAGAVVGDYVAVGDGTIIDAGAVIHAHCVIGKRCRIRSGAVIGSEGFGFIERPDGSYRRIPHIGNVIIEDDVEVGANTCIDRATLGSTVIGRGTKIDNLVHIAHNVVIGEHTAIAAQVGIAGSSTIGKRNRIGGQAGIVGHITTTDDVTIGAQSGVSKSITAPGEYSGTPAVELARRLRMEAALRRVVELLPLLEPIIRKLAPTPTDQIRDEQE